MASEKVLLEILNNRFTGIVEEMGYVIHRASFTVFVKETWDFDLRSSHLKGRFFVTRATSALPTCWGSICSRRSAALIIMSLAT